MKNIFKQLEGWVIPSNLSEFKKAVIALTLYYILGVFIVLTIFNLMVYGLFSTNIKQRDNEKTESSSLIRNSNKLGESGIQEMKDNLINVLIISDVIILFLTLLVAYASSKKTLAPLEEAYEKQKRFVADAAHELRTPLAVMKAGAEVILKKSRKESEYVEFIKESLEETERLTNLSNDLLFLAHKNERTLISLKPVNFSEICQRQIKIMQAYAELKNIKINTFIDPDLIILGKGDDLIRLIINLVKNAIDYNKVNGQVILSLKKSESKIVLKIEDNGIGIADKHLPLIFGRFYKTDNSRTQSGAGTGLGLAIVWEIVKEHKGIIKVTSLLGQKTVFEVIFPEV